MNYIEKEAKQLRARFTGVNRAKFARDFNVPGGDAMIYQHINGIKPISLDAAFAYATGFNCKLSEISERLAEKIAPYIDAGAGSYIPKSTQAVIAAKIVDEMESPTQRDKAIKIVTTIAEPDGNHGGTPKIATK